MTPWRDLLARLHAHDWVVYAKQPLGGPAQVLEYLGRYTHRVAISNERIVGMDEDSVSLRVRDSAHGNRRRTLRLPAHTFIDRFLLHVLPTGFKRIRHYGLLGPAGKALKLAQARAALSVPPPDPVVVESVAAFMCRIDRHRLGALWALRAGMLCAHRTDCGIEGAPAPAARTAVKSVAGTDCVEPSVAAWVARDRFGLWQRSGCVAAHCSRLFQAQEPDFSTQNASVHLPGCHIGHAIRLTRHRA